jgi:hypothetical protein
MNSEDFTLEVLVPSESGGERESVESIRFNAPKFYQSQDRAVTTSDYNSLLLNKFGNIVDSVVTWGGEEETPPRYGTVFLSVRPRKQELLTHSQSNEIIKYLKTKNLPCIDIELVDPSYIDVDMNVRIDWNKYKTTLDKADLTKLVENASKSAFSMYTTSFKSKFLYSKFVSEINALDNSIESVLTDFILKQYIYPDKNINLMTFYNFEFHNEIEPGSVFVERWNEYRNSSYTYSISDMNEDGILWLSQTDGTITKNSILGKVDYANGVVSIDNYHFNNVANKSKLAVQCKPVLNNLYVVKRHLLRLNELNVEISEI